MKKQTQLMMAVLAALALLLPALAGAFPAEVSRTGQTGCYDIDGNDITCAGTGQDGAIQAGAVWPDPRFSERADGTVSDNLTGLVWAQNANWPNGTKTWQEALEYVADMNAGTHPNSGHTDWRLPNVNELESLVHAGVFNPALPENPFSGVQSSSYWSSTSYASSPGQAWIVHMNSGSVGNDSKTNGGYVWPVRSGQCGSSGPSVICLPKTGQTMCYASSGETITCAGTGQDGELQKGVAWPDPRFIDHGDGTVSDSLTGLEWTKAASPGGAMTWQQALDYVKTVNTGGHSDWRLPNWRELRSLVDHDLYNPSLPPGHPFSGVLSEGYCSSTSYVGWKALAEIVHMDVGGTGNDYKTNSSYVWPVRAGQVGHSTTTTTVLITTTSIISSTTTSTGGGSTTTTASSGTTTTTTGGATTTAPVTTTTTTTIGPCPATQVLGVNNPEFENLRNFRDSKLAQSAVGRSIIRIYYANAESISAALEHSPALRAAGRKVLEEIASMLGR
jgi:hypothetical protein